MQEDADRELKAWEEAIKARELAEKRRVAPGWLDSDARILEPERKDEGKGKGKEMEMDVQMGSLMDADVSSAGTSGFGKSVQPAGNGEGDELDRAFGGMELK